MHPPAADALPAVCSAACSHSPTTPQRPTRNGPRQRATPPRAQPGTPATRDAPSLLPTLTSSRPGPALPGFLGWSAGLSRLFLSLRARSAWHPHRPPGRARRLSGITGFPVQLSTVSPLAVSGFCVSYPRFFFQKVEKNALHCSEMP